jgi:hypothetical protein
MAVGCWVSKASCLLGSLRNSIPSSAYIEAMRLEYSNPFTAPGVWLKRNLHTHTTESDGIRTPQEAVDLYRHHGYDFLSITDHGVLVDVTALDNRGMVMIPGQEISVGNSQAGTPFHIVAANIRETLPLPDFDHAQDPQKAIDLTNEQGGFTIVVHPYWSGLHAQDLLRLSGYIGVEIYNSYCDVYRGIGFSSSHIDVLLAAGRRPLIFATDDHHGVAEPMKPSDACRAWIMVKARDKTLRSIIDAIRRGLFYSSNGPTLNDIEVTSEGIHVESSPVRHITFVSTPSMGSRFTAGERHITEYTYACRRGETYVRVEAADDEGRVAWSNALYVS